MGYSQKQQDLLDFTSQRVRDLFESFPAPAHGIEHAQRVAMRIKDIAEQEGEDVFFCELLGWLHDVGRAAEFHNNPENKQHQELSYDLLRVWFREVDQFQVLSESQKLELLYGIRWHWNDRADGYKTAIILRDADKLDAMGRIGLDRIYEFCAHVPTLSVQTDLRFRYHMKDFIRTKAAQEIFEKEKLFEPIETELFTLLDEAIVPCEL